MPLWRSCRHWRTRGAFRGDHESSLTLCWAFSERVALSAFTSYQATIIDGDSNGFGADRHEFIVARENPGWGLIRKQADNDRTRSSAHDVIAPYGRVGFYRQRIVERTPMNDSR
jgi:hypothetical protein